MDYWEECVRQSFDEAKIDATKEQIDIVVEWVEGAHDNYGMTMGHECIPNPLEQEKKELEKRLDVEMRKVHCKECNGSGRIISNGPYHSSNSECYVCRGDGRYLP